MMNQEHEYPDEETCYELLRKYQVPDNIKEHSLAVKQVAVELAKKLRSSGVKVNLELVASSALLHDIAKHICLEREQDKKHPDKGAEILREEGYEKVARVVAQHGLDTVITGELEGWEEKVVYYADKRVLETEVVSLKQRLNYLRQRYPDSRQLIDRAAPLIRQLETELKEKIGCTSRQGLLASETNK